MKVVLIASIPEREQMLERTVRSLRNQVDEIRVSLNDYKHIPKFLSKNECIILDNSMGDAAKYYFADQFKGYILTCDDDLIYPPNYVNYMIRATERYNECAVTLHGRDYSRPVIGFQQAFKGYPCLGDVLEDIEVDVGGDGVMCWHTDYLKVKFEDFKSKNMSQLWFAKLCIEQQVPIICLAHKEGYLKYQYPTWTIWDEANKEGFREQTALLKTFL